MRGQKVAKNLIVDDVQGPRDSKPEIRVPREPVLAALHLRQPALHQRLHR
jgi:hypothetical protein